MKTPVVVVASRIRSAIGVVVLIAIALLAIDAAARPGGGSSFSGRSSSSSSSSSSGSSYRSGSSSSSSSGSSYRSTSSSSSSSSGSSYRSSSSSSSSSSGSTYRSTSSSSSTSSGGSSYYSGSTTSSGGGTYTGSSGSSTTYSNHPDPGSTPEKDRSMGRALLMVFLIIMAVIVVIVLVARRNRRQEWIARNQMADMEAVAEERTKRYASIDKALRAVKATDDAFSYVLFEDFLYALYAEAQTARGDKKKGLARLSPYIGSKAQKTYSNLPANKVTAVIVGGMRVEEITAVAFEQTVEVSVVFTSNVSEEAPQDDAGKGKESAYFMEERWVLRRQANATSRPPERARVIGCPNCGAPLDKLVGGECGYCNTKPKTGGGADWFVTSIEMLAREARGPMLTGTTEEVGTDLPTVVAPNANKRFEKLRKNDPSVTWTNFAARVEKTFYTFHESWCAQDLTAVRPYLSDNLFELQTYWVDAYKRQKLRNLTKDAKVATVHLARIVNDRYFDSITVRVFATCIDYTVDANDKVVGGNKKNVREYSEYWTFIRGVGKTGAPHADGACPNCGASFTSASVNMAGTCTHCNVKITSGEFDWVLSRIEQDEVYEVAA